jgi:hydrogenase maturation protease
MKNARTLVIGVGNAYRGDDAVGLLVVRALRAGSLGAREDVTLREHHGDGTALIESWAGHETVVVIDAAVQPNAPPGTIVEMTVGKSALPSGVELRTSSHAISVIEAVRLARELQRLPKELRIYCVLGAEFTHGGALSPPVMQALPELVARITTYVGA